MKTSEISRPSVSNRPPLTNSINIIRTQRGLPTNQEKGMVMVVMVRIQHSLHNYNLPETHEKEKIQKKKTMLVDVVYIYT